MRKYILVKLVVAFFLLLNSVSAQDSIQKKIMMAPYQAKDNSEVVLVWDVNSSVSISWYYDKTLKKFKVSDKPFQLPDDPGVKGNVMMAPYIGNDGAEVVLVWSGETGKSVSWYYDSGEKKFIRSKAYFQLPAEVGVSGDIMMQPYKAKDGSEVILVWDKKTGKSVSWYWDIADNKYKKSPPNFQLPQELGLTGEIMMRAYIAKDGSEVIYTWSVDSGESINWYYDIAAKIYKKSPDKFQLPVDPAIKGKVMMYPFLAKDESEVVWIWSVETGKSSNWYFDVSKNKFVRSTENFQIKNPLTNCMLIPYLAADGSEVVLTWSYTGKSIGWYYDVTSKKFVVSKSNFQLPTKPM